MEAHEGDATVLAHDDLIEPLLAVYDSSLHERAEMLILSDSVKRITPPPMVEVLFFGAEGGI